MRDRLYLEGIYVLVIMGGIRNFVDFILVVFLGFINGCGKILIFLVNFYVLFCMIILGLNCGVWVVVIVYFVWEYFLVYNWVGDLCFGILMCCVLDKI